ncbi:HTH-type transcriptional regulator HdfR [Streptomyces tendae]
MRARVVQHQGCDKRRSRRPALRSPHTGWSYGVMELTVWRTFVTVCRLGSLSAAAAELHHTQSAVSRQIAGLERQLGVPLMERHARGVRPTPAGEVFRHHALATLNEADRAVRAAREAGDGAFDRPLAVGATPSLAAGIVPEAVRALLRQAGSVRWSLLPGLSAQLHHRVITGDLDIAVVTDAPPALVRRAVPRPRPRQVSRARAGRAGPAPAPVPCRSPPGGRVPGTARTWVVPGSARLRVGRPGPLRRLLRRGRPGVPSGFGHGEGPDVHRVGDGVRGVGVGLRLVGGARPQVLGVPALHARPSSTT